MKRYIFLKVKSISMNPQQALDSSSAANCGKLTPKEIKLFQYQVNKQVFLVYIIYIVILTKQIYSWSCETGYSFPLPPTLVPPPPSSVYTETVT